MGPLGRRELRAAKPYAVHAVGTTQSAFCLQGIAISGTSRTGPRRPGGAAGLAPGPQAMPMPAAALVLYWTLKSEKKTKPHREFRTDF
jgi:hypothetical protein